MKAHRDQSTSLNRLISRKTNNVFKLTVTTIGNIFFLSNRLVILKITMTIL